MQLSDYDGLIQLWRACPGLSLRAADSIAGTKKYLQRNPGHCFVAEQENAIVGSLMAGHDGRRGYIQHLAVAPMLREQGVASRLVELCLQALKLQGIVKSHVHVLNRNQPGRDFWSKRGWVHREEIEMYSFINGDNENA
jgi:ribosomal protein S18 acetylase RimI-like enzyme